jgi:hypothetical protein
MPRYLLERTLGDVTRADLDGIADHSTEIRLARFPEIEWEHVFATAAAAGRCMATAARWSRLWR